MQYQNGIEARIGDTVHTGNGNPGVVERVLTAGSDDSAGYSCSESGGLLIKECWKNAKEGYLVVKAGSADWEDLDFVRRASGKELRLDR